MRAISRSSAPLPLQGRARGDGCRVTHLRPAAEAAAAAEPAPSGRALSWRRRASQQDEDPPPCSSITALQHKQHPARQEGPVLRIEQKQHAPAAPASSSTSTPSALSLSPLFLFFPSLPLALALYMGTAPEGREPNKLSIRSAPPLKLSGELTPWPDLITIPCINFPWLKQAGGREAGRQRGGSGSTEKEAGRERQGERGRE